MRTGDEPRHKRHEALLDTLDLGKLALRKMPFAQDGLTRLIIIACGSEITHKALLNNFGRAHKRMGDCKRLPIFSEKAFRGRSRSLSFANAAPGHKVEAVGLAPDRFVVKDGLQTPLDSA